jgi:cytochrome P450
MDRRASQVEELSEMRKEKMTGNIVRPAGPEGGWFGIHNLIRFQKDTLGFLSETARKYGDLAYFRMAAFHFYLLGSPETVYEALISQGSRMEKWPRQTATWANAVGHSSLTMEGDVWKQHRRLLNPAFHSQTVKRYLDIIIEHTDRLVNRWQDGQTYEMMFEMMRTTMGIIADIIFSVKNIEKDAADLNRALTNVFEVLTARTTAFQQTPLWIPTRDNRRIQDATKVIEGFVMKLIQERRKEGKNYGDVLSDLLFARDEETGATLSDREICNELKTLFGAGHETTALMLMWTLYLLAIRPAIQDKLVEEVESMLKGKPPVLDQIKEMPYTEMVLNESMRLFPPAWSLMVRQAREPMQIKDTVLPEGSLMLIPMWIVHRNPTVFADPLEFNPDRFEGDWKKKYPRYAFFPFGGGPHVCLGAQLAMFEGQIILPMMIQKYRFIDVPRPEIKLQPLLTLRPKDGLRLKVQRR